MCIACQAYLDRGIVPAPERANGRRRYSQAALQEISLLQFVQRAGFRLAEVRQMLRSKDERESFGDAWRVLAQHKLVEIDAQIEQLQQMKRQITNSLACPCQTLAECELIQTLPECHEA